MKSPKAFLAAAAFALFAATAAEAADIAPIVIPSTPPPPPPMAAPAFSWAGAYIGLAGTITACATCGGIGAQLGLRAGYDFAFGRFIAGINAKAMITTDFAIYVPAVEGNGRLGIVLGDRALAYAQAGYGYFFGFTSTYFTAGGGLAFALGDRSSVYGEVTPYWFGPGTPIWRFTLGVDLHLAR